MLYGNHSVVLEISNKYGRDNAFASAPLWYARFRPDVPDLPTSVWKTYTLWQFSSEINCKKGRPGGCLYTVPGTNPDMDINVYNGSVKDLRARWPFL
jgi:hypothetical protein